MILREGIRLYHGSYCIVEKPDLSKCRTGKDFGRGFYLTTSRQQAVKFTKTAIRKALREGSLPEMQVQGYVSEYEYRSVKDVLPFEFDEPDSEWLHCVVGYRKGSHSLRTEKWDPFDIVAGKIANDNTNLVITTYMDGLYGEVGSTRADQIAIGFLEPQNLKDQVCFRTVKALECLKYIGNKSVRL